MLRGPLSRSPRGGMLIGGIPLVLGCTLTFLFFSAPTFYATYLYNREWREQTLIEILTFLLTLGSGILLLYLGLKLVRVRELPGFEDGLLKWTKARSGGLVIIFFATMALFLAGEEVDWGRTLYFWPESQQVVRSHHGPLSLHNQNPFPVSVQTLGLALLFNGFLTFPLLWRTKHRFGMPLSMTPAVPEIGSMIAVISSTLWERDLLESALVRNLLGMITGTDLFQSVGYANFLDQMDEQRELMIAVSFLIYSLCRTSAVKKYLGRSND